MLSASSSPISAYGPIGAGIPNHRLDHVVGVLKAYSTCVGAGPFAAENAMPEFWMESLRKAGAEYGAATGRPRRVGPFDAVASRYGVQCQGCDELALTLHGFQTFHNDLRPHVETQETCPSMENLNRIGKNRTDYIGRVIHQS